MADGRWPMALLLDVSGDRAGEPHRLPDAGRPAAPPVGEHGDDLEPPAVLVVIVGPTAPRSVRRPVLDLQDDLAARTAQPQVDRRTSVNERVRDQLTRHQHHLLPDLPRDLP